MEITLLKYPTAEDWAFVKQCALVTIGKQMVTEPDLEWKRKILQARLCAKYGGCNEMYPCEIGIKLQVDCGF